MIPITAATVGCIGASNDHLQDLWSRRNPAGCWLPIDVNQEPTAGSEGGLDCLLIQAAEDIDDLALCIRSTLSLLRDDGVLIVDLPNPFYWRLLDRFLRGVVPPASALKSDESLHRQLTDLELRSVERFPILADPAEFGVFRDALTPALETLGIDQATFASRTASRRTVWRAARRVPAPLRVVQRVLRPVGGLYHARTHVPMRGLATVPGFVGISSVRPNLGAIAGDVPTIVVDQRRTYGSDALPFIRRLRQLGCLLVAEVDDDPDHWPGNAQTNYLSFRAAHAVQTSTEPLAARLRQLNTETIALPNCLESLPDLRNFVDPDRLTLFFGAVNRFADLAPLLPALNAVLAAAGHRMAVEVVHDRAAFDAIETPHKRFTQTTDYASYRSIMGGCEIALLPLRDTPFNSMKSDLKFIEAAGSRLASIASPTGYAASIRHGDTGLIAQDGAEWRVCLEALLADRSAALRMAANARAEVAANRMLASATAQRLAWYRSLLERRAELDAALLERVPELGDIS
jgi:hypothetical protein